MALEISHSPVITYNAHGTVSNDQYEAVLSKMAKHDTTYHHTYIPTLPISVSVPNFNMQSDIDFLWEVNITREGLSPERVITLWLCLQSWPLG